MKKGAIVGVEGSGKTVMLAGLGELYTHPDEKGFFLGPKNFPTASYVAEKIARMRSGEWPSATAGDEMQGLDWTLSRQKDGGRGRPENVCEVSFLDFAGEVYRAAYGISNGGDASLKEQAEELKQYVCGADELIVLINLRDVITNGIGDKRVQESMWITKSILDMALDEEDGRKAPRAAIVLSQADSYVETIKACGGALGVLKKYLPYVANSYGWLDVFSASAVDKTDLDDNGNMIPAADFTTQGLLPILEWIRGEEVADGGRGAAGGGRGATALPSGHAGRVTLPGGSRSCATATGVGIGNAAEGKCKKVQLWKDGPYWAEMNVGAENPWESGYYFWWGDTVGYKFENGVWMASDGSSSGFSFKVTNMFSKLFGKKDNIPTSGKEVSTLLNEGWITQNGVLAPEHDAAHVKWGGEWRMPTDQELKDLCEKCDWTWTQMNGVNGYSVHGRGTYATAKIFLPAVGYGYGASLNSAGSYGTYWSSVPRSGNYGYAWNLDFLSSSHGADNSYRGYGQSVRPVQGFAE